MISEFMVESAVSRSTKIYGVWGRGSLEGNCLGFF